MAEVKTQNSDLENNTENNIPKKGSNNIIMSERKRWGFFGIPWTFTKYTLTQRKLIVNRGFFKTIEEEILLYRIIDITLTKTVFQRMFGLGTIIVYSTDKTNPELIIKNIKNSYEFKETLSDLVEDDRIRRGVHQSEFIGVSPDVGSF